MSNPLSKPLEVNDFSGGITDNPVEARPTQYEQADNLLINDNKELVGRPGSILFDSGDAQLPAGTYRVQGLINYKRDTTLFGVANGKLYRYTGTTWSELVGPSSVKALPSATSTQHISHAEWRGHLLMTSEAQDRPIKVYPDESNTYRLRTAGLPTPVGVANYDEASLRSDLYFDAGVIRADLLRHLNNVDIPMISYTKKHRAADSVAVAAITFLSTITTDEQLFTVVHELLQAYSLHHQNYKRVGTVHYAEVPLYTYMQSSDLELVSTAKPTTIVEAAQRLQDISRVMQQHYEFIGIHSTPDYMLGFFDAIGLADGPLIEFNWQALFDAANQFKSNYTSHLARAGGLAWGHALADAVNTIGSANATNGSTLRDLLFELGNEYEDHVRDQGGNFHNPTDPASSVRLSQNLSTSAGLATNPPYIAYFGGVGVGQISASINFLNELYSKFNAHVEEGSTDAGAGHPHTFPTAGEQNLWSLSGALPSLASYNYAFVYKYEYQVRGTTYIDRSAPLYVAASQVIATTYQGLSISNLPVLANTGTTHYDTTNIDLEIYRTTNGGTTYYLVDTVDNGTTSYTDNVKDTDLVTRERLYTTGGVVENDPAPRCKYLHVVANTGYYANLLADDGEELPYRIRQSIQNDIDSCPLDFFVDLPDAVEGVSSAREIPITGTRNTLYRLEGIFDEQGRGAITPVPIASSIGVEGPYSYVQIESGTIFAGSDGFYFTDAYQIVKLSDAWNTRYAQLISTEARRKSIKGVYDRLRHRVWYSACLNDGSGEADTSFILDLRQGLTLNAAWTTASGTSYSPSCMVIWQDSILRGHKSGYVFKHVDGTFTDPAVDTGVTPSSWMTEAIAYLYKGPSFDFGSTMFRSWVPDVTFKLKDEGNMALEPISINDLGRSTKYLKGLRRNTTLVWGDPLAIWGSGYVIWDPTGGAVNEKRRFPAGGLRCANKQLGLRSTQVVLMNTASYGQVTVDFSSKTATFVDNTKVWPTDFAGYIIAFANDDFVTEFTITARGSATEITFSDPSGDAPADGVYDFEVRGLPKNAGFRLLSYCLHYTPLSQSQSDARGDTGV